MNVQKTPVVNTGAGKIEGIISDGLCVFKGIPYAAPPIGDLRWMPPQPVKPWQNVYQATQYGPIAPQNMIPGGFTPPVDQPQSEDCLFLNVYTPGVDDAKRPVMVWIHGGAFIMGSGSDPQYEGSNLPKNGNVVLVTINYRLGMLGFLRLKDATGNNIPATGNEGLLDQVAALKWVKENIRAFGGDPENITIFGESAGAMSIGCLIVMPQAKGLFRKAIMESGVGNVAVPREDANRCGELFLQFAGIAKDDAKALRALTPTQLLELENKVRVANTGRDGRPKVTPSYPVTDGEVIPDFPNKLARRGAAKDIICIVGNNLDEYTLFAVMEPGFPEITKGAAQARIAAMLPGPGVDVLMNTYGQALQKRGEPPTPANILTAISGDLMWRIPTLDLVEAQVEQKTPVYNYLFTWQSPAMGGVFKACHALEIGFVFGKYDPMFCGAGPEADKLSECMQQAWLNFAKTGNPSGGCAGEWPDYGKKRMTMVFGKESRVEAAPYESERAVWETIKRNDSFAL